jgi:pyruvate dehydrogenase E2 component (dihydrolipoamide acetyltransferase)
MAKNITIPKLGMTMTEAKIVEWKFGEGQMVNKGQVVLVLETAKVTYDLEALDSGYLHIIYQPEAVLGVGDAAGQLAETEEELRALEKETPGAAAAGAEVAKKASVETHEEPVARPGRVKISPVAKKLAEDSGIDYTRIEGTGPDGRIVKEDIEKALEERKRAPAQVPGEGVPVTGEVVDGKRVKKSLPLKGMRAVIAEHMHRSLQVSAQLTSGTEVEMTEMIRLRESLKSKAEEMGIRLTYTDIFVYLLAKVLKEQPIMNSSLIGKEIKLWEDINIGVAVALEVSEYESGLVVVVVRNADRKNLYEISQTIKELVERARNGRLMPDDISGGTFTLTNTGGFNTGWSWGTPIINQPEMGIFQTGPIVDRPVAVEGQVVVRPMMPVALTFDHRVLDGVPADKFLARMVELIRNPYQVLL